MRKVKKNLKFAIIGGLKTENTQDLIKEIRLRGHQSHNFHIKDISFGPSLDAEKISTFDIFLLRSGHDKYQKETRLLARELLRLKKTVIDEILGKDYINGKMSQALLFSKNRIAHPKTFLASSASSYKKYLKDAKLPIIVKPDIGKRGIGIQKFNGLKKARAFFQKNVRGFLVQEYLPAKGDIRVFIVGGNILGAIYRNLIKGDFRSNVSLGAKTKKINLTKEARKLSRKAVLAVGLEVAGVDLIRHNNKYYVLEVNEGPQWQGFKETTGIDPAKYIVEYALKKYYTHK